MFPEFRDLISRLKTEDAHFARLFNKHNELDQQILNMESGITVVDKATIHNLKKEKLKIKDMLYVLLKKESAAA
jgi:uncharacterized protein